MRVLGETGGFSWPHWAEIFAAAAAWLKPQLLLTYARTPARSASPATELLVRVPAQNRSLQAALNIAVPREDSPLRGSNDDAANQDAFFLGRGDFDSQRSQGGSPANCCCRNSAKVRTFADKNRRVG